MTRLMPRDGSATVTVSQDSVRPIRLKSCGIVLALDASEAKQLALALADAVEAVQTAETATLGA